MNQIDQQKKTQQNPINYVKIEKEIWLIKIIIVF